MYPYIGVICVYSEGGGIIEVISKFIADCPLPRQELKFARMEMVVFLSRRKCPGTISNTTKFVSLLLIEHCSQTFI